MLNKKEKKDKKKIAILALLALLSAGAVGLSMKGQFKQAKTPTNEATTISVEKVEVKEDAKPETKVETKTEVKVEVKPTVETKTEEKPVVETKVKTKEEVKEEVKPVVETKVEAKPETKVETKPAQPTTQTAKVETKVEAKPATTTTKPATQSVTKPATPVAKPAETKPVQTTKPATTTTKPAAPKPVVKQPVVTTKDETVALPFTTERAYNIPGAQTRVKRQGVNGSITYRITYKDGVQVKKEEIKRVAPVNQIVETYVKVQDRKVEIQRVEDKSKPLYEIVNMERVEVYYNLDPSLNFVIENLDVYAARQEAREEWMGKRPRGAANNEDLRKRFGHSGVSGWRDLQPRAHYTDKIVGYELITKEVVVQEEVWAWK